MPEGDFSSVRRAMIKDFSKRQQAYHERQGALELDKTELAGGIEKDINLALQRLRNKGAIETQTVQDRGAMERLSSVQQFESPLQKAQIQNIGQETKSKAFDLRLGMDYSGSLLERAMQEKNLIVDALQRQLTASAPGRQPLRDISTGVPPLEMKPLPINVMDYHPWVLGYKGGKKAMDILEGVPSFLSRHFRRPTLEEE